LEGGVIKLPWIVAVPVIPTLMDTPILPLKLALADPPEADAVLGSVVKPLEGVVGFGVSVTSGADNMDTLEIDLVVIGDESENGGAETWGIEVAGGVTVGMLMVGTPTVGNCKGKPSIEKRPFSTLKRLDRLATSPLIALTAELIWATWLGKSVVTGGGVIIGRLVVPVGSTPVPVETYPVPLGPVLLLPKGKAGNEDEVDDGLEIGGGKAPDVGGADIVEFPGAGKGGNDVGITIPEPVGPAVDVEFWDTGNGAVGVDIDPEPVCPPELVEFCAGKGGEVEDDPKPEPVDPVNAEEFPETGYDGRLDGDIALEAVGPGVVEFCGTGNGTELVDNTGPEAVGTEIGVELEATGKGGKELDTVGPTVVEFCRVGYGGRDELDAEPDPIGPDDSVEFCGIEYVG
jgi:hypothetical protein